MSQRAATLPSNQPQVLSAQRIASGTTFLGTDQATFPSESDLLRFQTDYPKWRIRVPLEEILRQFVTPSVRAVTA